MRESSVQKIKPAAQTAGFEKKLIEVNSLETSEGDAACAAGVRQGSKPQGLHGLPIGLSPLSESHEYCTLRFGARILTDF